MSHASGVHTARHALQTSAIAGFHLHWLLCCTKRCGACYYGRLTIRDFESAIARRRSGSSSDKPMVPAFGLGMGDAITVEAAIATVLAEAGLLLCSDGTSLKTVNDCYALRSLPMPGVDVDGIAAIEGRLRLYLTAPLRPGSTVTKKQQLGVEVDFVKSIFKFPTVNTRKKF
jgi:hypothetical protein